MVIWMLRNKMLFHQNEQLGNKMFVPLELGVDESSNPRGLELVMVVVCNSNDEIPPNIDWEFRLRSRGLDCFKIYIH